ncbi:MAG: ATP phosphoribosyltransferase [Bacteroidales bacterium]|jgi:ATP phosphoribosyltransferase|nr:ATP phosphoribosyltransferase [Bacteroidales bacterium]
MSKLKIAIQKSGRLTNESHLLLKECGISIDNGGERLKASVRNFPAEILYLRNSDIPQYVEDGVADIAILGENLVIEKRKNIQIIEYLGFSRCRLSIAIPKNTAYPGPEYFIGKRLATSYPNSLNDYLESHHIRAEVHEISGSVEIAPNIGLADAICDLVSSGSTLFSNGLKEVEVVLKSQACLVAGKNLSSNTREILNKLLFRIRAVMASRNNKYILLNSPNTAIPEISKILPGMKSPTIMPLAEEGWCSMHSVISETDFWNVIGQLKAAGAQGILVLPIEKMVI